MISSLTLMVASVEDIGSGGAVGIGAAAVSLIIFLLQSMQKSSERNEQNLKHQIDELQEEIRQKSSRHDQDIGALREKIEQTQAMVASQREVIAKLESELKVERARNRDHKREVNELLISSGLPARYKVGAASSILPQDGESD